MADPHAKSTAFRPSDVLVRRRWRNRHLYLCIALLALCALGFAAAHILRQQRREYRLLCHRVEAAVAPGEPVLVTSWVAAIALRWMGSPALKQQVIFARAGALPGSVSGRPELIVVSAPNNPLLRKMRSRGFSLSQELWESPLRDSPHTHNGALAVFFAVAPAAPRR